MKFRSTAVRLVAAAVIVTGCAKLPGPNKGAPQPDKLDCSILVDPPLVAQGGHVGTYSGRALQVGYGRSFGQWWAECQVVRFTVLKVNREPNVPNDHPVQIWLAVPNPQTLRGTYTTMDYMLAYRSYFDGAYIRANVAGLGVGN